MNLESADVEDLIQRLTEIFRGWQTRAFWLDRGQLLYRAVRWADRPSRASQLGYPPAERVGSFGRVNRPGQSMFYCSVSREAPFFELRAESGDHVALSRWRVKDPFWVNNVGYTELLLGKSNRTELPSWAKRDDNGDPPANRLINTFLSEEFSRDVDWDKPYLYKMSVAIAQKLFGDINGSLPQEAPAVRRFGGVVYPALAMRGNSDNVALLPEFVDSHLEFKDVEFIRVDSHDGELKFDITRLDFASTLSADGEIEWKGGLPQWTLPPGGEMQLVVENGQWVARDKSGNVIEPH